MVGICNYFYLIRNVILLASRKNLIQGYASNWLLNLINQQGVVFTVNAVRGCFGDKDLLGKLNELIISTSRQLKMWYESIRRPADRDSPEVIHTEVCNMLAQHLLTHSDKYEGDVASLSNKATLARLKTVGENIHWDSIVF